MAMIALLSRSIQPTLSSKSRPFTAARELPSAASVSIRRNLRLLKTSQFAMLSATIPSMQRESRHGLVAKLDILQTVAGVAWVVKFSFFLPTCLKGWMLTSTDMKALVSNVQCKSLTAARIRYCELF